jgi:alpha-D-ribose 1-methylphosphonate 5-triphosphate synthase subunit PhnG
MDKEQGAGIRAFYAGAETITKCRDQLRHCFGYVRRRRCRRCERMDLADAKTRKAAVLKRLNMPSNRSRTTVKSTDVKRPKIILFARYASRNSPLKDSSVGGAG